MSDDLEFIREMDEQARQVQGDDTLLDTVEALHGESGGLTGDELEAAYDSQGASGMTDGFMPGLDDPLADVSADGRGEAGAVVEEAGGGETGGEAPVSQDELNTLVGNVTELGADNEVLGKERLLEAFREAESSETKGGSYVEGFTSAVQRMLGVRLEQDPVEQPGVRVDDTAQPEETGGAKERFQHHKERYDAQFETVSPWPRDTVSAYHRMAMTYNAYVAGEKINGMEVSKIDVFLSGVRFYQSNIFETAIIRSLRFAGDLIKEKYAEDRVETGQNATETEQVRETRLKDDVGGFDHGDATAVSGEEVKSIRNTIKEYGIDYGIDTTRGLDRSSTDNVRIFRPTDYVGRVDIGPDKTAAIPGVRLVEIDGNRALVAPDGKVVHENTRFGTADGFRPEDYARIESRCDIFRSPALQEQLGRMADSRGVSIETVKAEYVDKALEAYAGRIEKTMLGEADRLERQTIPEAREELNSLREDLMKLDRIDASLGKEGVDTERGISKTEIAKLRSSLQSGIETLESRITAMEGRVELLRDTHAQIDSSSVKDRFERAANAEEQAVGRGGRIEYISSDVDKRLVEVIDVGSDRIVADVERFNEAHPDMQLTYDTDTGELYNRFGVSDTGEFNPEYATVDTSELPADNPEAIREYISEHAGDDFDAFREFISPSDGGEAVETGQEAVEPVAQGDEGETSSGGGRTSTDDESEETEAKVLAGHDDDISSAAQKPDAVEGGAGQQEDDSEYGEKVRELFSDYLNDTEGIVSLADDIQGPLVDLTHEAGKDDFHDAMDILSDMVKGIEQMQPAQLERIAELVHAVADISSVPADAIDAFQESIQGSDFAEELIAELGKPELTIPGTEVGAEAQVTIGDEQFSVGETGLHDAISGEPAGGFQSDDAAAQYLETAQSALFETRPDVEVVSGDVEVSGAGEQQKFGSLADTFDEIGSGAVSTEEAAEAVGGIETGAEVAGGVEAAEAAGGAAAAEAAVEAGVAGSAAFL